MDLYLSMISFFREGTLQRSSCSFHNGILNSQVELMISSTSDRVERPRSTYGDLYWKSWKGTLTRSRSTVVSVKLTEAYVLGIAPSEASKTQQRIVRLMDQATFYHNVHFFQYLMNPDL